MQLDVGLEMDEQELVSELLRSLLAAVDNEKLSHYPQLSATLKQAVCKKGLSKASSLSLLVIIEKLASYRAGMIDEYAFRVALKGYCRSEWLHPHSPTVSHYFCSIHTIVVVTRLVHFFVFIVAIVFVTTIGYVLFTNDIIECS